MLCRVTTADGLQLDGDWLEPSSPSDSGFVFVHGTGSNFYAPGILEQLALNARESGHVALRINTRGHDGVASIPGSPKSAKGGATYEVVAECVVDLTAWCQFAANRGLQRLTLVGHSMGGVKSIYSQAHAPHGAVQRIVCLSPPRFCHQHWMTHPQGDAFRRHFAQAQTAVTNGRPLDLFECQQPTPFIATAAGFIEKYGPEDRYDIMKLLPHISVPVLVFLGQKTLSTSPAFDTHPSEFRRLAEQDIPVTLEIVTAADMSYSGHDAELWQRLRQ